MPGGVRLVRGGAAGGKIGIADAVKARIGFGEIIEHELIFRMAALPGGDRREFLSPVDVGIAEQPRAAARRRKRR